MIEENFNLDWGQYWDVGLKELVVVVMDDERDFFFFWSVCGSEACFDLAKDLRLAGGVIAMAMNISID